MTCCFLPSLHVRYFGETQEKQRERESGGWRGRQLKAGAHLLRLPCQVKEEAAMNIEPEVCVSCVCRKEREEERQTKKRERKAMQPTEAEEEDLVMEGSGCVCCSC